MEQLLIQLFFGWPAIVASLLIGVAGIYFKKPLVILLGGLVVLPHTYYLSGFGALTLFLPLAYVGCAAFVWRRPRWPAALWLLPQFLVDVWLAVAVLTQRT